jgi:uncharacterized protein YjiS (DUF1127 family)
MLCGRDLPASIDPAPSDRASARLGTKIGASKMSSQIARGLPPADGRIALSAAFHPRERLKAVFAGVFSTTGRWFARSRQRRALRELAESNDRHLLRDIGISQADAFREADKPFWRR